MTPHPSLWVSLIVGAVLFGASLVGILVARRSLEPVFAVVGLAAFGVAAWAFGELSIVYDRFDVLVYALAFGVAAFAGGYALASTLLASLASHPRRLTAPTHACLRTPAPRQSLLLGDVEPDDYDERGPRPISTSSPTRACFTSQSRSSPSSSSPRRHATAPSAGTSPAARQLESLAERVGDSVRGSHVDRVETAWLGGARRPRGASAAGSPRRAIGPSRSSEVMIAGSLRARRGEAARRRAATRGSRASTSATPTRCGARNASPSLVASRVMAVVDDPATTGVVLVGHRPARGTRAHLPQLRRAGDGVPEPSAGCSLIDRGILAETTSGSRGRTGTAPTSRARYATSPRWGAPGSS